MIATIEQQTTCKVCGHPITQKSGKGHRPRIFCSQRCKQADYRRTHQGVTIDVTIEDEKQQHIAELERENRDLRARLDVEERYRTDTAKRSFKTWLRTHAQATDSDFPRRFLDDRDLPMAASRSHYTAMMKASGRYSRVDLELFADAWKSMLLQA